MSDKIPSAKASPRVRGGTMYWYEGDTFRLKIRIRMQENDIEKEVKPEDTVRFEIQSLNGQIVFSQEVSGIEDNTMMIEMNRESSMQIPKGEYKYNIRYNGEFVRTLAADNRIEVQ